MFRNTSLMNASDSALVVIDMQQKLVPLITDHQNIVANIARLVEGAKTLGVRVCATEQYPQGLGGTVESLRSLLSGAGADSIPAKTMFSCRECESLLHELTAAGVTKLLLTGIETHVCVAQSALDFIAAGFSVYVCVDAVGSRGTLDHQTAIRRLENAGAIPTTTEAALFEWCEQAGSDRFKAISKLVTGRS
jgi:nicotinamidase-related amidase